jgi:hypothetical protein
MYKKLINRNRQVIVGLLVLCFFYSLLLPYSLFKPILAQRQIVAEDQLYPVLAFSLANSYYVPIRETNVIQINILSFASNLVSFVFQNQLKVLQLNPPKFPTQQYSGIFTKAPTYLKKRLLRI